jgi:hypothetical protein
MARSMSSGPTKKSGSFAGKSNELAAVAGRPNSKPAAFRALL